MCDQGGMKGACRAGETHGARRRLGVRFCSCLLRGQLQQLAARLPCRWLTGAEAAGLHSLHSPGPSHLLHGGHATQQDAKAAGGQQPGEPHQHPAMAAAAGRRGSARGRGSLQLAAQRSAGA